MSLAERFQGADEVDQQLLEAFEAMRVALTIYRTHEHPLSEPCRNHACAALALADKVAAPNEVGR